MAQKLPVHFLAVLLNVLHQRGQVFKIGGMTFFTMGGTASHDIQDGILGPVSPDFEQENWFKRRTRQMLRVKGISWWPEEFPSEEEYEEATSILKKLDGNYTPKEQVLGMKSRACSLAISNNRK